jgi:hypothetical protein
MRRREWVRAEDACPHCGTPIHYVRQGDGTYRAQDVTPPREQTAPTKTKKAASR